jgi:predicted small secreted protein
MSRRAIVVLAAVLAALTLAACGGGGEGVGRSEEAQQEGTYVEFEQLTYQVQLSRYLNPADPEDKQYLEGLPEGINPVLPGDETWFGVWMRVKNYSGQTLRPTTTFTIVDTEGNEYRPVPLAASNPFAYTPTTLQHSQVLPTPDTAAASGPIQGSLILFRLKTDSLQNRPLTLEIGASEPARMDLDL